MDRRKNFADTLAHRQPKSLVIDFGGSPQATMEGDSEGKLLEYLGYAPPKKQRLLFGMTAPLDERLLQAFHSDVRPVGGILVPQDSAFRMLSDDDYIDEWGVRRRYTGLYWESMNAPLEGADLDDLAAYRFPDPASIDPKQLNAYAERAKHLYEDTGYIVCAEHPVYGIFELGCWLCGFEDFLYRMLAEPEFVHAFFGRVLAYQKSVITQYYGAIGPYIHYTTSGDDFATQNGPFFSPDMFGELVAPYLKERIAFTRRHTGAAFMHHSCGAVFSLVPHLLACGVEILNPIQPKARDMQPEKLKAAYGDRIVFHGGIDTQELLPFLEPAQIKEEVCRTIETLNQDGGYIFAAAHNIQPDVKPENLVAMMEAAAKYRAEDD